MRDVWKSIADATATFYLVYMTLYNFKMLSDDEQKAILWEEGTHLAVRSTARYNIGLFQISGFMLKPFIIKEENTANG